MFKDNLYATLQLRAAADRLIAVVRCESVETLSPGMRRERQVMTTSLLAPASGLAHGSTLQLGRWAQAAPQMAAGPACRVGACRAPAAEPGVRVEHRPVDPARTEAEPAAAAADIAQRLR